MNDVGLLNDYDLNEIGITFDEYDNPTDEVLDKIEDYRDKKIHSKFLFLLCVFSILVFNLCLR